MALPRDPEQPLAGIRVLVVEDDEDSREIIHRVLEYSGAVVVSTMLAKEALTTLAEVDIVVTDIALPDQDGVWLLREIQQCERPLPVIAVSGYSELYGPEVARAGFVKVMRKPVDPWALRDAIRDTVRGPVPPSVA
jgi:CheY-like chemotaxis protein